MSPNMSSRSSRANDLPTPARSDAIAKPKKTKAKHRRLRLLTKQAKLQPLICKVCGDRATGYNFGALVCESCKSFYRRHAHRQSDLQPQFRCRCAGTCDAETELSRANRRRCGACRLEKCFAVGMLLRTADGFVRRPSSTEAIPVDEASRRALVVSRIQRRAGERNKSGSTSSDSISFSFSPSCSVSTSSSSSSSSRHFADGDGDACKSEATNDDCSSVYVSPSASVVPTSVSVSVSDDSFSPSKPPFATAIDSFGREVRDKLDKLRSVPEAHLSSELANRVGSTSTNSATQIAMMTTMTPTPCKSRSSLMTQPAAAPKLVSALASAPSDGLSGARQESFNRLTLEYNDIYEAVRDAATILRVEHAGRRCGDCDSDDDDSARLRLAFGRYFDALKRFASLIRLDRHTYSRLLTDRWLSQVELYSMFGVDDDLSGWRTVDGDGSVRRFGFDEYVDSLSVGVDVDVEARDFVESFRSLTGSFRERVGQGWEEVLVTLCLLDFLSPSTDSVATTVAMYRSEVESFLRTYLRRKYGLGSRSETLWKFCTVEFPKALDSVVSKNSFLFRRMDSVERSLSYSVEKSPADYSSGRRVTSSDSLDLDARLTEFCHYVVSSLV